MITINGKSISAFLILSVTVLAAVILDKDGNIAIKGSVGEEANIIAHIEREISDGKKPNRLIDEKSPYLLQHAFNPVDWFPWGEEAFERARREDKPIFLSIGYSTCYWCHVMEREVFENVEIARMLNEWFVCIKVDREERPDIDGVYMLALQAMMGGGGWPMSLFLNHEQKPFYGGTYIPPTSRHGRPGFIELITRINSLWRNEWEKLNTSASELYALLKEHSEHQGEASGVMIRNYFSRRSIQGSSAIKYCFLQTEALDRKL